MIEMKDSGIEWIGQIPKDWTSLHLKYLCSFKTGGTPKNKVGIDDEGDFMWVTPSDMPTSFAIKESNQYISKAAIRNSGYELYPPQSILLVCIASVGKVGIVNEQCYSNQQITALKPNNQIYPKFLLYSIVASSDKISFDAASNVVPIVNTKYLESFGVAVPEREEQKRIADFLDAKCSEIDVLTADIEKQIETLEAYKKSVITEAVTKGLNPDVEMKDSGIEWIGQIPKNWKVIRLKHSSTLKGRIGWQGLRSDEYIDDGPYLITGTDFSDGIVNWNTCAHISDLRYEMDKNIQVEENDLLITKDGTIGKTAIVKNCPPKVSLNSGVFIVRNDKQYKYCNKYLFYIMNSNIFYLWYELSQQGNSTIKHLTQDRFYNFAFTYPDYNTQETISEYLDKKCTEIDSTIQEQKEQLSVLADYKKSLIYEYVTGKKEVPNE